MEVDKSPKEKPSSKKTKKQKSNKGVSCLRHFKAYASLTGPAKRRGWHTCTLSLTR